jgi:hypothetical protein
MENNQSQIIYEYNPEDDGKKENKHIKNTHFRAIITNDHIYHLPNKFNKMTLKEAELFTSEFYRINTSQFVEEYITKKEQLLIYKFEKDTKYKFYYSGDLTAMLLWFKKDLKYHPQVQMTNTILRIAIKVNESYIMIIPYKAASDLCEEVISSESDKDKEYMKLYVSIEKKFEKALLSKEHLSYYEETLKANLLEFPINAPIGYLNSAQNDEIQKADLSKAYASVLYKSKFIPVASAFDGFKEFQRSSEIIDEYIYIIEVNNKDMGLFLSTKSRLIYGVNLKKVIYMLNDVKITHVCELNKCKKNDIIPDIMDEIKNSGLQYKRLEVHLKQNYWSYRKEIQSKASIMVI